MMKTKRTDRIGGFLMAAGLLAVAAALALTMHNIWEDDAAGRQAASINAKLVQELPEAQSAAEEDAISSPAQTLQTLDIDGVSYIGTLDIPALDISLPIRTNLDMQGMKHAPCRYSGSPLTDDLIIAGHNYKKHFGRLSELQAGDEIVFTDADGFVYRYAVSEIEQLPGDAVEQMQEGDWDLTLFTCTPGGANRVTVRCIRDEMI